MDSPGRASRTAAYLRRLARRDSATAAQPPTLSEAPAGPLPNGAELLRAARAIGLAARGTRGAAPVPPQPLNLALQGGGAYGAFTWGVLDRLLEDGRTRFVALSGASAGAMNAVALAAGLLDGGPEGARRCLAAFWNAVSETARYSPLRPHAAVGEQPTGLVLLDLMTRLVSPYQFNPLDFNPLRDVLAATVDFQRLRRESPVELYIAATDVANGRLRIFRTREISLDAVLASACLPHLHKAVKVGRRYYWDGGYTANPPILPLVRAGAARDTLIVQTETTHDPKVPTSAPAIIARLNRLTFSGPLRREIELIEQIRGVAGDGIALGGALRRQVRAHRFHHIGAGDLSRELGSGAHLHPDRALIEKLRERGRAAAEAWLRRRLPDIGRRSSVDLAAKFL